MRAAILATAGLMTVAASAASADQWSGFYAGGNLGYGSARATADFSVLGLPLLSASENLDGFVYGAQLGYNFQVGRFVLGLEGDIQGTSQKARSTSVCAPPTCGLLTVNQTSEDSIPWLATGRLRAGIAIDRALIYGTAGLAVGEFKSTETLTTLLGTVTSTASERRPALVLGAGVEAKLHANWSAKVEYLYLDTGKFQTNYSLLGIGVITQENRMTENIVRLGLNYHFR